jgi:hypothetical protein
MSEMYLIITTNLIKDLEFYYNNVYYVACSLSSTFLCYWLYTFFIIGIHKTIILPVVLYGYETLYLTVRQDHRPGVLRTGS